MRVGAVVLTALALLVTVSGCSHEVDLTPPRAASDSGSTQASAAQAALDGFVASISDADRSKAEAAAAAPSRSLLGDLFDNARALHVADLSMRYVSSAGQPTDASMRRFGHGAFLGTVDIAFRYAGFDQTPARVETQVLFAPVGGRVGLAGFGTDGVSVSDGTASPGTSDLQSEDASPEGRTPFWLVSRLTVVRTDRTLVAVAGNDPGRYPQLVSTAVEQVQRVLTDWRGPLVVEVPASEDELNGALAAQPGEYDDIAAVTTTADGSLAPGAPVRIFVNPSVFDGLQQRGAQVVMSHESTHVAVGAPFASMPTWLLEGFADWVALEHANVPVRVAAHQILTRIRAHGLPQGLPTPADLDPTANGLGATYEEAWLACRYLGQTYGEAKMIAFYRAVNDGRSTQAAFSTVLGTSQGAFVAGWRRDLARLVRVTG